MSEIRFSPRSIRLAGSIRLHGPVEKIFPLFSPLGEKAWVPGWDPELLHPPGATWEPGLIFRTKEERGDAIWVVTHLDRRTHHVEYHRVEPGRYVARVRVACRPLDPRITEATVEYEFVGLSETGNADIAVMSEDAYAEKMSRWTNWINDSLQEENR